MSTYTYYTVFGLLLLTSIALGLVGYYVGYQKGIEGNNR